MKKWALHKPGTKSQHGCSQSCRNSCCDEAPPASLTIRIAQEASNNCDCIETTLTYTTDDNHDGVPGMWENDSITIDCGSGCSSSTIKVELWCSEDECGVCECSCLNWSIRINEGTTYANTGEDTDCCCNGNGGRNWLLWRNNVVAGTGDCSGETFWIHISWDSEAVRNGPSTCIDGVNTLCCAATIAKELEFVLSGPCSTDTSVTLTYNGENACDEVSWSGSGTNVCTDGGSPETCYDQDFDITIRCTSTDAPTPTADLSWEAELSMCGTDYTTGMVASCPTCDGTPFSATGEFSSVSCGSPCSTSSLYAFNVYDRCSYVSGCYGNLPTFMQKRIVLYTDGETDCACGTGILQYEAVTNECGCVGQWRGTIAVECKSSSVCTSDTVEVELCSDCEECDLDDCDCTNWKLVIDGGTAKGGESGECCCTDGSTPSWIEFGDVTVGAGAGSCATKTLRARVYWDSTLTETLAVPADGTTSTCYRPIAKALLLAYTDTCLTSSSVQLAGSLTCDDEDYWAVWSGTKLIGCYDGVDCDTITATFYLRYKRDFTWETEITGCFGSKTQTVTPDCGDCADEFEVTGGTWSGSYTGCDECNTTRNITYTITEI